VGKQEQDDFFTSEDNVQRKRLNVELEETEEHVKKREVRNHTLSADFCIFLSRFLWVGASAVKTDRRYVASKLVCHLDMELLASTLMNFEHPVHFLFGGFFFPAWCKS
jgi:hypothetical protein